MENNLHERYDRIYTKRENVYGEPDLILEHALDIIKNGSAIELGAGEGRNSLLMASKGLEVTAVDFSKVAIEKIKTAATEANLNINTRVADITDYHFEENYDLIISTYVFHHLSESEANKLIKLMQDHTNENGINVISTFTKDSDFYREESEPSDYYPDSDDLKKLYEKWEILTFDTKIVEAVQKNQDGTPKQNNVIEIMAKKKAE